MRVRRFLIGTVIVLCAVTAWAQVRDGSSESSGSGRYRITHWPDHEANHSYTDEVEQHLNKMAAEGWRFHSEIVGQSVRMMVFERAAR